MSLTVNKATQSNKAYVHTKRIQMEEKAQLLASEGLDIPDPDAALLAAERTSMPFDD